MTQRRKRILGLSADAERGVDGLTGDLDARLKRLERKRGRAPVVTRDTAALVGEFLNIEAPFVADPGFGLTIILPEATGANRGEAIGLNFRSANRVRIVAISGLVNGVPSVISNARGSTIAISNGLDGWELSQSITVNGVVGAPGTPGATVPIPDQRVMGNDSGASALPSPITVHQELDWVLSTDMEWVFDGVDDRVDFADVNDFERTDSFTVSAWVKTPSVAAQQVILGKLQAGPGFRGWEFGIESPGRVYLILASTVPTNWLNAQTTNSSVPVGALTHLAAVYDGTGLASGVTFYVNGVAVGQTPVAPGPVTATTLSTQALVMGRRGITSNLPFQGSMSHVALFPVAKTAADITDIYNAGTPPDLTAEAPSMWVKFDAVDAVGAGGIVDHGSGASNGTAGGGLAPSTAVGSLIFRSTDIWQTTPPGTSGLPLVSNGTGAVPSYQGLTDSGIAAAAAIAMTKTGALTGDVTKASGSSVTAIGAGVIVDADVNAAAAIAQTKLGATTGFSVKASGSAATTSAEPIVTYSASANMSAERVTTSSTSVTVSTAVASQIEFQRAALTGDVTAAANSNTTAIAPGVIVDADVNAAAAIAMTKTGALTGDVTKASGSDVTAIATGVIVNADVNASAGIALSKLENIGANAIVATTTGGTVPTAIGIGSGTVAANISEGPTATGLSAISGDNICRWAAATSNVRIFEEDFAGNLVHHIGGDSRFSIVSGLAGIALTATSTANSEFTAALNLSTGAALGTTRGVYALGANENAANFHFDSVRYFSAVFRLNTGATTANTQWCIGLVGPHDTYGAVTVSTLAGLGEGIFVEGVTALSANVRVGYRKASATSTTDTGIVATVGSRYQYEFFRTSAGDQYHYLNGTLIRTDAAGAGPSGNPCTFFATVLGSTTAERMIQLDYIKVVSQSVNRYT